MVFTGSIILKIIEASDLKPTQLSVRHLITKGQTSMIDPFVNIAIDDSTIDKTTSKSRTFKPIWNETFDLSVIDAKCLQLTVFNRAVLSNDEFVANCSLLFDEFADKYHPNQPKPNVMEADLWVSFLYRILQLPFY